MKKILVLMSLLLISNLSFAESLEEELTLLNIDKNERASIPLSAKVYSIQPRKIALNHRLEVLIGGGENLSGNNFLLSRQVSLQSKYYFNDSWSVALAYSQMDNRWNNSAKRFMTEQGLVPDVDFVTARSELRAQYNIFYGKLRWSRDSVSYFDQYIFLGMVYNQLASGLSKGPVAGVGFTHWISNWGSFNWGFKDYYYKENAQLSSALAHNLFGYVELGYIF